MLIIGKIIGVATGYWLGGFYGSLIGLVPGHMFDYFVDPNSAKHREIDYAVKVIALGAKVAKADGVVTVEEIAAFKKYFQIPESEMKNVAKVFNMAKKNTQGYEEYARQLVKLVNNDRQILESVLDGLFYIANADLVLHPDEEKFLYSVAMIFGLNEDDFKYLLAFHTENLTENPYGILGVTPDITDKALKERYYQLAKDNHPDRNGGKCPLPASLIKENEKKMARINDAYTLIKNSRTENTDG